jgi:3-hydroxymyristoyl/3-hydroxydecanoyl-(acyl carrier protein) dehydratase
VLQAELDKILICGSLCLVRPTPAVWQAEYDLREDFVAFQGHFPGYPILPAFVQICMAQHALSLALDRELELIRVSAAKFTGRACPGVKLLVACSAAAEAPGDAQGWDCVTRACGKQGSADASAADISKFRFFFRK